MAKLNKIELHLKQSGFDIKKLLNDPTEYVVSNMSEAARLIKEAVAKGINIFGVGDYDVDGIASVYELTLILKHLGANFTIRLPRRFSEGYGISQSIISEIPDNSLLITIDNGITAIEAIDLAKSRGMTVVILDHHQTRSDGLLPDADCIVDPHVFNYGTPAEFNGYCGAGLAYMLAKELELPEHIINQITVLAAIATIADSVPLIDDNRNIVRKGLTLLNNRAVDLPGIYALCKALELTPTPQPKICINEEDIAFKIAPTINAMGRMLDNGAIEAFEYLANFNIHGYSGIEKMLERNQMRKTLSSQQECMLLPICDDFLENHPYATCIVVTAPDLHEGIIGILAAKIVERYNLPAIVLGTTENGLLKGSARSIPGVNIKAALDEASEFLIKHGGHEGAAGLTLAPENLEMLIATLNDVIPHVAIEEVSMNDVIEIQEKDIVAAYAALRRYAPFGTGFPAPIFRVRKCPLQITDWAPRGISFHKSNGFSLKLPNCKAVSFGYHSELADKIMFAEHPVRHVDVIGTLGFSTYRGENKHIIYLKDLYPSTK